MSEPDYSSVRIRDVPRSCTCLWRWDGTLYRWVLNYATFGCPWHQGGK